MKISFNGKEYNSTDEMPPDIRQAYEALTMAFADKDRNGVPDIFETEGAQNISVGGNIFSKIIFEGKEYSSPDELPPDARAKYERALGKFGDADRNGIPDMLEDGKHNVTQVSKQFSLGNAAPPQGNPSSSSSPATNDTRLFLVGIAIVGLLVVVAIFLALVLIAPRIFAR